MNESINESINRLIQYNTIQYNVIFYLSALRLRAHGASSEYVCASKNLKV